MPISRDRLRRAKPSKVRRESILIFCEGKKTEFDYFTGLCRELKLTTVTIYRALGDPKNVVEEAIRRLRIRNQEARRERQPALKPNSVWCVFDVDQHERLDAAKDQCRAVGMNLALSNPCFELWLVLHLDDHTAPCQRHEIQRKWEQLSGQLGKSVNFSTLGACYETAIARARLLEQRNDSALQHGASPSSTVFKLVEILHKLQKFE